MARVVIVTPAPAGSLSGNRVTAERWQRCLAELGHDVAVLVEWDGEGCDVLVALHARRSAPSVRRWRERRPDAPLVVGLAGTDVYQDLPADDEEARASIEAATLIVALQPLAAAGVGDALRARVRIIRQSAVAPAARRTASGEAFTACVLAHLREVKDPGVVAAAARRAPEPSRLRVLHAGAALEPRWEAWARREERGNPRWRWLGPLPHDEALELLASSHVLVVPSRQEGGANVVSEALACGVPIVASRIPGSLGLLGDDYPATFPPGDAAALAALLSRLECDPAFRAQVAQACARLRPLVDPARERAAWADVLEELGSRGTLPPA